jgi:hypothetical protein
MWGYDGCDCGEEIGDRPFSFWRGGLGGAAHHYDC